MPDVAYTQCAACKTKLKLKTPDLSGKKIRCPKCKEVFVVKLLKLKPKAAPQPTASPEEVQRPTPTPAPVPRETSHDGTLVSWEEGIGDDKKYSIAHVSPNAVTLVPKMKDYQQFVDSVAEAKHSPEAAVDTLMGLPKAVQLKPEEISRVTFAKDLWQLTLFDQDGNKTKVPNGNEQAEVFAAIKEHLGGTESEEEADAWAVMQTPLFILSVIAVIGGFFIYFTTICDPNYEATGRRSGMKALMNTVGYKIGPVWMSVIVGSLAALALGSMIYRLIKRPIRQVLEYNGQE